MFRNYIGRNYWFLAPPNWEIQKFSIFDVAKLGTLNFPCSPTENDQKCISHKVCKRTKKKNKKKGCGKSKSMYKLRNKQDTFYSLPFDE